MTTCATKTPTRYLKPRVNVAERDDTFVIEADLPGVAKDGISVTVDQGDLVIEGRRAAQPDGARYVMRERPGFDFRRRFELGEHVDANSIDAAYGQGVLTVTLRKSNWAKTRTIPVN